MREARLILEKSNFPIWFFVYVCLLFSSDFLSDFRLNISKESFKADFFFSLWNFHELCFTKFSVVKLVQFCFMKCSCHHSFQNTSFLKKGGTNYRFFSFCLNRHINCFCWAAWLKIMHNVVSALSSAKELFLESPNAVNFTNQH